MTTETTTAVPATENKPTKKAVAKKAAAKKVAKKAASKKAAPAQRQRDPNALSGSAVKVLTTLAKNSKPLTRGELSEKTGINKGWSKLLGASTTEDGPADTTLVGRKLVKCELAPEGERGLRYSITATGKAALDRAKKAE